MEDVILVDLNDKQVGTMDKMQAHTLPYLHRAFSVFIVDGNKMLIQKRAFGKYHSGGLWANACCSHPRANKDFFESVYDRLQFELGINEKLVLKELFTFTYLSKYDENLFEYEYDHVILASLKNYNFNYNTEEISDMKWVDICWLKADLVKNPQNYATWFIICAPKVIEYLEKNN